jgi:ABC-type multidrug transport system fused ATPase/permease subunit
VQNVDQVLVRHKGRVREQGTHQELGGDGSGAAAA